MINFKKLNDLYYILKDSKSCYGNKIINWFTRYYFDEYILITPSIYSSDSKDINTTLDNDLLNYLIQLKVVNNYNIRSNNKYYDIDIDFLKLEFIIRYNDRINKWPIKKVYDYSWDYVESLIDKINIIWFGKVYRTIDINWEYKINDPIYFVHYIFYLWEKDIIEKLENFLNKSSWLYFDDKSWKVYYDKKEIWIISINTQPFSFFKFIYDSRWVYKTHTEIKEYIKWKDKIQKSDDLFCRNVKNELPNKVKKLIKATKGGYLIP